MAAKRVILPVGISSRTARTIIRGWTRAGLESLNGVRLADLVLVPVPAPVRLAPARAHRGTTRGARHLAWDRR